MKPGPTYLGPAGGEVARERIGRIVRYGELIAAQESALEGGDLERFRELADEVADLRREIGGPIAIDSGPDGAATEAQAAADALRDAYRASLRIQERLKNLRDEDADRIRTLSERRPQAGRYADEASEAPVARLDLTL